MNQLFVNMSHLVETCFTESIWMYFYLLMSTNSSSQKQEYFPHQDHHYWPVICPVRGLSSPPTSMTLPPSTPAALCSLLLSLKNSSVIPKPSTPDSPECGEVYPGVLSSVPGHTGGLTIVATTSHQLASSLRDHGKAEVAPPWRQDTVATAVRESYPGGEGGCCRPEGGSSPLQNHFRCPRPRPAQWAPWNLLGEFYTCTRDFIKPEETGEVAKTNSNVTFTAGIMYVLKRFNEPTRRYSPLRGPTSSSCGGLRPRAFFALRAKKELSMLFWPIFGNFLCPVVTLVTFSSYLSNFERNCKKTKKSKNFKNI